MKKHVCSSNANTFSYTMRLLLKLKTPSCGKDHVSSSLAKVPNLFGHPSFAPRLMSCWHLRPPQSNPWNSRAIKFWCPSREGVDSFTWTVHQHTFYQRKTERILEQQWQGNLSLSLFGTPNRWAWHRDMFWLVRVLEMRNVESPALV